MSQPEVNQLNRLEIIRPDVIEIVKAQRRRRRVRFWVGFVAIALIGALWAGLSKDPLGPDFQGGGINLGMPALASVAATRW